MFRHLGRTFTVTSALLFLAGSVSAQGVAVRTWGYYDSVPGPVFGERYSVSPYWPTVSMYDSWGRLADMPLRPKVLYYDTPFLTPQGWYRPTSIVVMPDPRPRYYPGPAPPVRVPAPPRPAEPAPRTTPVQPIPPATTFPYDGGPADPVPDVAPDRAEPPPPAPRVIPDRSAPMPPVIEVSPDRPATKPMAPATPALPQVPKVPTLPDVPKAPPKDGPSVGPGVPSTPAGVNPPAPKLGPTPMDIPPTRKPGG